MVNKKTPGLWLRVYVEEYPSFVLQKRFHCSHRLVSHSYSRGRTCQKYGDDPSGRYYLSYNTKTISTNNLLCTTHRSCVVSRAVVGQNNEIGVGAGKRAHDEDEKAS